ncbi:MAG TPA: pentapeptide repeat-containing protein [Coleofasciculaceae cyanobacterium]|jgi:predicted NACHT family NTPase
MASSSAGIQRLMTSIEFTSLLKIVATLTGFAATPIKNKLERNEAVIKLLKKFEFNPDHPPTDFSGVYAYTLVEYGIGKPQPVLELFRQDEIRQAFQEAFEQNDPSILLKKGQDFIDGYALGDQIKEIGIEPLSEFATFAMHFLDVTRRTRTPAEVVRDQKIDNLQRGVSDIQDQLARLKEPQEVLLEFALQAKTYQALQPGNDASAGKVRKFILERQMRSWFTALKYDIESYEVEGDTYFELIINIPARRGYDRIVVRGVEGEAKLADVVALRKAVDEQKTKEGWLVAARRISSAACDATNEKDNKDVIFCYTFDQLLDQDADFNKYLDWLEAEVKRKGIDRMYVPLACTKDEFDPITKEKIGVSKYDSDNDWVEGYINRWLDDPSKEHVSILGEFGTGKTWLTLHYAWKALQKYRTAKDGGIERPRIPLVIPLRDYAKAVSVESLFSEFFFRKYEIPLPGYSVFEQLNRMGKFLLIFDGFDEMADRVDNQKMINNFWELARVVVPGSKAILTCRTEHFPEAKEGRALLNAELKASIAALTGEPPQFEVLELEKFNDEQIRQVLSFRAGISTVEEIMGNPQLLDLARRPVMTELILEALPEIEAGKPIDMSRIYLYAVREKMKRDIKAERTFTSLADKLYFLCELSWEMLSSDQMSLNYRLFPDRLRRLFSHAVQEQKNLDHWHYDMMGQTMLIRNADGDYMPAHRSLLEFFVAYKFAAELGVLASDFLELAQEQSHLSQDAPTEYTWSSYFRRSCSDTGEISPISPLKNFIPEDITLLASTVGKEPLTTERHDSLHPEKQTAILELIGNMISSNKDEVKGKLLASIRETSLKLASEVGVVGGNIATILCNYDREALQGENLVGANLRYADFSTADLSASNLGNADLRYANFSTADLSASNLGNADLSNSRFDRGTLMYKANLKDSILNNIFFDMLMGWISRMHVPNSQHLKSSKKSPAIHFLYPRDKFLRRKYANFSNISSPIQVREGEIVVAYMNENEQPKWLQKIQSVFILNFKIKDGLLHFLTIEGDCFSINIATGEVLHTEKSGSLRTWQDANFENAQGLTERDIYTFRILGGINLPNTSYIPQSDKSINQGLEDTNYESEVNQFEDNQMEDE